MNAMQKHKSRIKKHKDLICYHSKYYYIAYYKNKNDL